MANKRKGNRMVVILLSILFLLAAGCGEKAEPEVKRVNISRFIMDTYVTVTVFYEKDKPAAEKALDYMEEIEKEISITIKDSDIAKLNAGEQDYVEGHAAYVLKRAFEIAEKTKGKADPTLLALKELWDIAERKPEDPLPTQQEIDQALQYCGYQKVEMEEQGDKLIVRMPKGMGLDLGAFGKGYAVEEVALHMKNAGVEYAIVNGGGNVRLLGERAFNVGIREPRTESETEAYATIQLKDTNIITSGDYERYVMVDGVRYHHIFDPSTGRPSQTGIMSATIIGGDGLLADALSTAMFVSKPLEALELAKIFEVDVVLLTEDGKLYLSQGVKDTLVLQNKLYQVQE